MLKRLIQGILDLFYPIFKKAMPYQVYAYLAVGGINTALNIFLFIVLFQYIIPQGKLPVLGYDIESYTISLLIAFIVTVPTGFWLSKYFAFYSDELNRGKSLIQLIKYFFVVLQGLVSDWLILKGLIVFFDIYPTIAKVLSTAIVLTMNFILQKYFTFRINK